MKIPHRIPIREPKSATLTPEYQAEVDLTMARAEAAWKRAQRRLEKAEVRLSRAKAERRPASHVGHLEMVVELRRVELEQLHRMMTSTRAPATSRGVKSHRHVSTGGLL